MGRQRGPMRALLDRNLALVVWTGAAALAEALALAGHISPL